MQRAWTRYVRLDNRLVGIADCDGRWPGRYRASRREAGVDSGCSRVARGSGVRALEFPAKAVQRSAKGATIRVSADALLAGGRSLRGRGRRGSECTQDAPSHDVHRIAATVAQQLGAHGRGVGLLIGGHAGPTPERHRAPQRDTATAV